MVNIIMTSLPIFVCGVLSVLLGLNILCKWDRPRFCLLLFMLTATLLYIGHFTFFNHIKSAIPVTDSIYSFCNPAVFPMFYIYTEEMAIKCPSRRRQLLYLLPAFLCGTSVALLYLLMDDKQTTLFIDHFIYGNDFVSLEGICWWQVIAHFTVRIVFALEIPPVLILGWRHITYYNQMVENYYSNTEGKTLSFICQLLSIFAIAAIVSFICNFIGRNYFTESIWLTSIPSVAFSAILLLIGHYGLSQRFSINDIEEEEEDMPVEPYTPLPLNANDGLANEIRRLMEEERLYLQPNLKINDLAMRLNTNRNYIYNAINGKMGISFSEFVNQKRIEYAVQLMEKNPDMYLTEIAHKSGFSSDSSFYRNFKIIMGCTPSEYQKKQGRAITASTLHQ